MSVHTSSDTVATPHRGFSFDLPTEEYRSQPIPGLAARAKLGSCFVRVVDLPEELDRFMKVNPRVPSRNQKDLLSGPVCKGILTTLLDSPEDMVLKNQGIYLLVEDAGFQRTRGSRGVLTVTLTDAGRHGIVNGGHTYAAIRQAIATSDAVERESVEQAYVRLHIMQGIEPEKVPEIAEGLNRSKQVDDPSLRNLQGVFQRVKDIMAGHPGATEMAYKQGEPGEVYISEVLVYLQLFNCARWSEWEHPNRLYRQQSLGLRFFDQERSKNSSALDLLLPKLPEILVLADKVRKATPTAAKQVGFEFGRAKVGKNERAGTSRDARIPLPFIGGTMRHRVPNGWLFPMLAAFRANLKWDLATGTCEWVVPLDELLPEVMPYLAGVCVRLHRDEKKTFELVGKSESAYYNCYREVRMYLQSTGRLPMAKLQPPC